METTTFSTHSRLLKKLFFASLIIFGLAYTNNDLKAQNNTATQYNGWYMYFGNHRISDDLGIHTEYQWRRSDWIKDWQQSLLRFGLDWYAADNMMVTAGYGWIKSFPYGEQPIPESANEHRIWQQLILNQKTGRLNFQHRFRTEQRFIENINAVPFSADDDEYIYRNRARYRFFLAVPLTSSEMEDNTLFAAFYEEVFLGFGKGIGANTLDQNRLYLALGWRFNKDCNVQLGYLNHYVFKSDGIRSEQNHTLQMALFYNIDFRKG